MTDEEALRLHKRGMTGHEDACPCESCRMFAAGHHMALAHARQWRPLTDDTKTLTDDPKTWPEVGWIVVWDARMPTRAKAGRVLSETGTELMRQGWTHWLPLPEPPKGESK